MSGRWWTWLLMFPWVLQPIWLPIRQHLERNVYQCICSLPVHVYLTCVFNNCNFSELFGRARKTSLECTYITGCVNFWHGRRLISADLSIKLMGIAISVIKALFNINNQNTLCVISFWLSEALLPWVATIFFSCIYIWGM